MSSLTSARATRRLDEIRADDIMTRDIATVGAAATVGEAITLMQSLDIRHLPVVSQGQCIGVLDDRLAVFSLLRTAALNTALDAPVGAVVGGPVVKVAPGCPVQRVAQKLRLTRCDAVVVVDGRDCLLGILTSADLVSAIALTSVEASPED